MHRTLRLSLAAALIMCTPGKGATGVVTAALYQQVQDADVIVVARISDPDNHVAIVERVLKGQPSRAIHVHPYSRSLHDYDRLPLVMGRRELMFLQGSLDQPNHYHALREPNGRWRLDGNAFAGERQSSRPFRDVVRSIRSLVRLQAEAAAGGARPNKAFVTALKSRDRDVREWAYFSLPHAVQSPSPELVKTYLALWRRDSEATWPIANAVRKWQLMQAGLLMSREFASADDEDVRDAAGHALGAERNFPDSPQDVAEDARNASAFIRIEAAAKAFNLIRHTNRPDVLAGTRRLLEQLTRDPSPDVAAAARVLLQAATTAPASRR